LGGKLKKKGREKVENRERTRKKVEPRIKKEKQ
jgi:hypothetical protein